MYCIYLWWLVEWFKYCLSQGLNVPFLMICNTSATELSHLKIRAILSVETRLWEQSAWEGLINFFHSRPITKGFVREGLMKCTLEICPSRHNLALRVKGVLIFTSTCKDMGSFYVIRNYWNAAFVSIFTSICKDMGVIACHPELLECSVCLDIYKHM